MNCETLLRYLSDYLDQTLEVDLAVAAQAHLATCQNCQVVLDSTQKTILFARQEVLIPTERRQKLYEQIERIFKEKRL